MFFVKFWNGPTFYNPHTCRRYLKRELSMLKQKHEQEAIAKWQLWRSAVLIPTVDIEYQLVGETKWRYAKSNGRVQSFIRRGEKRSEETPIIPG